MSRRLSREVVFKALFQIDIGQCRVELALRRSLEDLNFSNDEKQFIEDLVSGTVEKIDYIDNLIRTNLVKWELERLSAVDRNLLRMAIYEILYRKDIPHAVSINEALELAKKYGSTAEAVGFINGILDRVAGESFDRKS